jgi:hypothetical protein
VASFVHSFEQNFAEPLTAYERRPTDNGGHGLSRNSHDAATAATPQISPEVVIAITRRGFHV